MSLWKIYSRSNTWYKRISKHLLLLKFVVFDIVRLRCLQDVAKSRPPQEKRPRITANNDTQRHTIEPLHRAIKSRRPCGRASVKTSWTHGPAIRRGQRRLQPSGGTDLTQIGRGHQNWPQESYGEERQRRWREVIGESTMSV